MKTNLDLKNLFKQLQKNSKTISAHASFAAIMVVLLAYIFVVWQISQFAAAEPADQNSTSNQTGIPEIDQKDIDQIQTLEQGNTAIHKQFEQARNNPFQE